MKKRVIISFALIFTLFSLGASVSLYNFITTISNLRDLLSLHEIEDIRQELSFRFQRIQTYTFSSPEIFSDNLDDILTNANEIDATVKRCHSCHHNPSVQEELDHTEALIQDYEEQLSHLITTAVETNYRAELQKKVFDLSETILKKVQGMIIASAANIQKKSEYAMQHISRSYNTLALTLLLTFMVAFAIAIYLTGHITKPIQELLTATNKIARGELGYQARYHAPAEFGKLIQTFNDMSLSLARKEKMIQLQIEEMEKTQRQLFEAEKLTALGTLAGGIAHDFNNILCGILGHIALLKRKRNPEDKEYKTFETIEKAGFRAADLTKQLLAFARREILAHRPVNINDNVNNVVVLLKNTINKRITIKLDLSKSLPPVLSDPAQLEQVVMNLCMNARDAMPEGGELAIKTEKVVLDAAFCKTHTEAKPGDYVKLTVMDQGTGIAEDVLPRIFEPFFTTKEVGKGTGLGLAMVYGVVKSHKGFCLVDSTPGKGTRFSVFLPVSKVISGEDGRPAPERFAGKATIMIVDDEPFITTMLSEHLQFLGCTTLIATNGEEAVQILSENRDSVDLVILDLNMPVMDGKETYSRLKEIKPDLLVLIASGYDAINNTVREILDQGADGHIQKPFNLRDLSGKIAQILKKNK
ncbi:MAG: response regulator [Desulfobacterales bacterium]|nr:response regulator [Desulfobacterales bacterium]